MKIGASVDVEGIAREFDDGTGLHETTAHIRPGEFVSVLGPSGCGKSTLLRCIAGLETPDRGRILFDDEPVFDRAARVNLSPNKRGLSMVFQDLALWPHMTVEQNIAFPLTTGAQKIPSGERAELVESAMEKVGIASKARRRPAELSGGQQQRVAIARAIVSRPRVVLMDEPLSALDAALRIQVRDEISALVRDIGVTAIYVTHDQSEALAMADRVMVLNAGEIRQFDSPVETYLHPADEFVAGFVGHMNLDGRGGAWRPEEVTVASGDGDLGYLGRVATSSYVGGHYEIRADLVDAPDGANQWLVHSPRPLEVGETIRLQVTRKGQQ